MPARLAPWALTALALLGLAAASPACRLGSLGGALATRDAGPGPEPPRAAEPGRAPPPSEARAAPALCVHQSRAELGAPVHRVKGGGGGFVRLAECTRLVRIEEADRWLRVAFPEHEGRTEGWISRRYVMSCEPCGEGEGAPAPGAEPWPPRPAGQCAESAPTGAEQLRQAEVAALAKAGTGARGRPGARLVVVSYNLWELYDGIGEPAYMAAEAHGARPAAQYRRRLAAFAAALGPVPADVLVLQEVEGAAVACALASRAWPRSGWSCAATAARDGHLPQNVAVASRIEGSFRLLEPVKRSETGPRAALELGLEGADGLTVTGVHLKSSRGESAHDDCGNARRRMGMAAALASRYRGWSSVLVVGDFNVDPLDTGRAIYDRTDDVLTMLGFARLCPTVGGCAVPTYRGRTGRGSAIDLAFFRPGGRWRPGAVRVVDSAPHVSATRLGSDHLPLVVELER